MQERLLQFIWQYNLYKPDALKTTDGALLHVLHPGVLNTNAGPDFSQARIRIGTAQLVGNIELHVLTSDFIRHKHLQDPAYRSLILHVVYEHDIDSLPNDIPVLELKDHIPAHIFAQYSILTHTTSALPCSNRLPAVKDIIKESWLSRLLVERWQEKLETWKDELNQCNNDWRTLMYWRMASNFGFKINSIPFLLLAQSLPLNLLAKQHQLLPIEALIFGQAGMLESTFVDPYPLALKAEYRYLREKYSLEPIAGHLWKFMRLRPANFPTIRLSQFAALLHQSMHLFTRVGTEYDMSKLEDMLAVSASSYWDDHYRFDEKTNNPKPKKLGSDSVFNIIVNTIAPVQFLYAFTQGTAVEREEALQGLEALPPENNAIIRIWKEHGWKPRSAADSQALLQLYNQYCVRKRCLECAIGLCLIRSRPDE